jgi:hypothetical protein
LPIAESPIAPHASSAAELKARLEVEQLRRPFLIYRDEDARQVIHKLPDANVRMTVGRHRR